MRAKSVNCGSAKTITCGVAKEHDISLRDWIGFLCDLSVEASLLNAPAGSRRDLQVLRVLIPS